MRRLIFKEFFCQLQRISYIVGEWHVLLHTIGKSVHTCATQTCLFIKILCYCNLHLQHLNEECHKLEMLVIYIYICMYLFWYWKTRTCLAFFAIYFAYVRVVWLLISINMQSYVFRYCLTDVVGLHDDPNISLFFGCFFWLNYNYFDLVMVSLICRVEYL